MPTDSARVPTTNVPVDPSRGARALWLRRAYLSVLAVIVLAGACGVLGVRSRTVTSRSADGAITLQVHYAQVARAGLGVPFDVTVHRDGGFGRAGVTLAITTQYLELFDLNAMLPEPSASTASDATTIWHFDAPPGDTFGLSLDMQVRGGRHWGRAGALTLVEDRKPIARASFKSWLSP
jgi:hypothetical protein